MRDNKIFGIVLLIIGLFIIFWGLYSSYNIFTNKTAPPQVFSATKISQNKLSAPIKIAPQKLSPEQIQKNIQKAIQNQLLENLPPDFFSKLLNLMSWSIFVWILILGGSRIAGLGIKLIKP